MNISRPDYVQYVELVNVFEIWLCIVNSITGFTPANSINFVLWSLYRSSMPTIQFPYCHSLREIYTSYEYTKMEFILISIKKKLN